MFFWAMAIAYVQNVIENLEHEEIMFPASDVVMLLTEQVVIFFRT